MGLQGLAAAVAAAAIIVVAAAQTAVAAAAAQDQENDKNPGASAEVVVAHIELPPFDLHSSVWEKGKSCYSLWRAFLKVFFSRFSSLYNGREFP